MEPYVNEAQVVFSPQGLLILNIVLGFIMFGVALELKLSSFKLLTKSPKAVIVGIFSQFILLPAITFAVLLILRPEPGFALGMILVAACPGGNMSNFISMLAKGNTELSVSLTAFATIAAIFITPLNFSLWGHLNPYTTGIMQEVQLNPANMILTVFLLLGLPVAVGMLFKYKFPLFTQKIKKAMKIASIVCFIGFVSIAFIQNINVFILYIHIIAILVIVHNATGLTGGYLFGKIFKLSQNDCRTISIETGMQNSGLALILIFNFFMNVEDIRLQAGQMAMIAII